MSGSSRTYSVESEVMLPRRRVWELLSDTARLNRALGLLPVRYGAVAADGRAVVREAQSRAPIPIPFALRWTEHPFQWEKERGYSVLREFVGGPIKRIEIEGGVQLDDGATLLPGGGASTRLRVWAEVTALNAFGAVAAAKAIKDNLRKTLAYCTDALHSEETPGNADAIAPAQPKVQPVTKARFALNAAALERALRQLAQQHLAAHSIPAATVARLREHLANGDDDDVLAMRPYALARTWREAPDDVLRLCLYGTKAGLLNLSWNLICPNCRVSKAETNTLSSLSGQFHCDLCGIDYRANFDRYVELRFSIHPDIRKAEAHTYCIGGPSITPHVWLQRVVRSGETSVIAHPQTGEALRLRVLRANHVVDFEDAQGEAGEAANDKAEDPTLIYSEEGWNVSRLPVPQDGVLHIRNQSGHDIVLVLEKTSWDDEAVTAARVTAMQEFRDLFSSEVLAPGQQVGVESLTLFFSDLRDSTQLYEMVGDAPAYGQVRRHFDYMKEWIAAHNGAIVKTIGDAVMAVFLCPEDGVRAALDMQRHLVEFNRTLPPGDSIVIKMGLHHGPAIAVNSNDRLDYFGRTVNLAARIQDASVGGDIVLSDRCFERPGVRAALREHGCAMQKFEADLKGIAGGICLYRARVPHPSPDAEEPHAPAAR